MAFLRNRKPGWAGEVPSIRRSGEILQVGQIHRTDDPRKFSQTPEGPATLSEKLIRNFQQRSRPDGEFT
jgi:hypothetical protein